jgi:serine/threonine-protein kinase RsbW
MGDLKRGEIMVTFPSHAEYVHMATTVAGNAAVIAGFDKAVAGKVAVATDEAVTNVIKHAYGNSPNFRITLKAEITPESLTLKVVHTGKALTNEEIKLPNMAEYIHDRRKGGLGLYIMKQFMDEVDYMVGKEHCCQMTKYRNLDKTGAT